MEDYFRKLAILIYCSEWLERLSAEFYGLLARRVTSEDVASLMRVISAQSAAHAEVMVAVLKLLELDNFLKEEKVDCVELTKPVGKAMLDLMDTMRKVEEVDALGYQEILDRLKFLEIGVGEETYHAILQPLLRSLINSSIDAKDGNLELRLRIASDLLDDVARQEKLHEELVIKSYEMLSGSS